MRRFQESRGIRPNGVVGARTRAALADAQAPGARSGTDLGTGSKAGGASQPTPGTAPAGNTQRPTLGNGLRVDTQHPILQRLATSRLNTGAPHSCVRTTHANLQRLGVPTYRGGTGNDNNNPRGALVQTLQTGQWESVPTRGSQLRTIRSPYGNVQANVIPAAEYRRMAAAGQIPSGALVFQTRHGWDYNDGSRGNDMGIARNGGRNIHNYANMQGIIYRDLREVVVMVPRGALQREE